VTGLPAGVLVVPAFTHECCAGELIPEHLTQQGAAGDLNWSWWTVVSPRSLPARSAGHHDLELRRVRWDERQPVFRPIRHARPVEVGPRPPRTLPAVLRSRSRNTTTSRLADSRSPASRAPCATCHGYVPRAHSRSQRDSGECGVGGQVRYLTSQIARTHAANPDLGYAIAILIEHISGRPAARGSIAPQDAYTAST
jgi:hypothetical protein